MTIALQGSPPTACTEHELVAAVRRGDDRAFELLFSSYERRITAYVAGMVGDHARAEDITQDVFISALRRMRETRRPIAFKPWIYEIAKNACIDEFRRTRRAAEVSFEEEHGSSPAARNVFVHAPAPDVAVESKQRLDDLCGAFGGLVESHHRVLVLRELEGLSYGEIGRRLGMSRAMVESTLFRARRRLSEEYEELASGRRCARVQSLIDARDERPLTSLGIRERRQLVRHLAHCRPCRRRARVDGVDESLLQPRRRIAGIAAVLPLPLLRWRRGASSDDSVARSGSHSIAVAQTLQNAAQLVDPSGPSAALGRAAAAAAAIALASAGGGIVANLGTTQAPGAMSAPSLAAPRLPVLSISKIFVPLERSPTPQATGFQFPPQAAPPGVAPVKSSGAAPASAEPGQVPGPDSAHPGDAGIGAAGTGQPGGSSGHIAEGPGAPGTGSAPGAPNGSSGGGVSVPDVSGSAGSSGPSSPGVPEPPSGPPSAGGPQVPSATAGTEQGVQAPAPSAQSTVQGAPASATQAVSQVQQSVPTSPPANSSISPPPGV